MNFKVYQKVRLTYSDGSPWCSAMVVALRDNDLRVAPGTVRVYIWRDQPGVIIGCGGSYNIPINNIRPLE
jgi:hypothetical protein